MIIRYPHRECSAVDVRDMIGNGRQSNNRRHPGRRPTAPRWRKRRALGLPLFSLLPLPSTIPSPSPTKTPSVRLNCPSRHSGAGDHFCKRLPFRLLVAASFLPHKTRSDHLASLSVCAPCSPLASRHHHPRISIPRSTASFHTISEFNTSHASHRAQPGLAATFTCSHSC